MVGGAYYLGIILFSSSQDFLKAPSQLNVILVGGLGGLLGSIIDSILGASLQFSGIDARTNNIVEVSGKGIHLRTVKLLLTLLNYVKIRFVSLYNIYRS